MKKYNLDEYSKCEDCDYRRNSTNPDLSEASEGDTIRCTHPDSDNEPLAIGMFKIILCDDCGSTHKRTFELNEYEGAFPDWCPLMNRTDLIAKANNIPNFKEGSLWQSSWEDGTSWEADDDIKKITVIFDVFKTFNCVTKQIVLTQLLET